MIAKLLLVSLGLASSLKVEPTLMNRRSVVTTGLAGLAAVPFAVSAKEGAIPIWGKRTGAIEKPASVKAGCNVEKPCAKGATFGGPYAKIGAQAPEPKKPKKEAPKEEPKA